MVRGRERKGNSNEKKVYLGTCHRLRANAFTFGFFLSFKGKLHKCPQQKLRKAGRFESNASTGFFVVHKIHITRNIFFSRYFQKKNSPYTFGWIVFSRIFCRADLKFILRLFWLLSLRVYIVFISFYPRFFSRLLCCLSVCTHFFFKFSMRTRNARQQNDDYIMILLLNNERKNSLSEKELKCGMIFQRYLLHAWNSKVFLFLMSASRFD